mmetsp:Transcript_17743/g.32210  ORF Transcript_17743/g.32210 Transcript_17743/m.32210 type:complete len:141 (+) Transcript_17743:55-477(+)
MRLHTFAKVFSQSRDPNISFIGEKSCILTQPNGNNFLSCTNEEAGLFGAYLSYDSGKEIWVRAGKATAAGKGSKRYYDTYPKTVVTWVEFLKIYNSSLQPDFCQMMTQLHCLSETMLKVDCFCIPKWKRRQYSAQTSVES